MPISHFSLNCSCHGSSYICISTDLIKELDEIRTICGIEACAVISYPNDPQPVVWPSESEAQRLISKFNGMPKEKQKESMLDQIAFLEQRNLELQEQLKKKREDNKKKEIALLIQQYMENGKKFTNMSVADVNTLMSWAHEARREFEHKFDQMQAPEVIQDDGPQDVSTGGDQQNIGHSQGLMTGDGEQENMGHAQGSEINTDVMQSDQH